MVLEKEMFSALKSYFNAKNFEVYEEVRFFSKKIDIICINKDSEEIIAVEMKVKKWKKALQQSLINQVCADKVYVAFWHENIEAIKKCRDLFEKYGVGVLEVNSSIIPIIPAKSSPCIHEKMSGLIKRNLSKRGEFLLARH